MTERQEAIISLIVQLMDGIRDNLAEITLFEQEIKKLTSQIYIVEDL
jgi:hypothetical protein